MICIHIIPCRITEIHFLTDEKITRSCGGDKNVEEDSCTDNNDMETCHCKTNYCNSAGIAVGSAFVLAVGIALTRLWQL